MNIFEEVKEFFDIRELVCDHVYDRHGENAWRLFDPRLLEVMVWIRRKTNRRMVVNSRSRGLTQRGIRCNLCSLVVDKSKRGILYVSPHILAAGVDFDIEGMLAEESRQWLEKNKAGLPHKIRLEAGVSWVHLDVLVLGEQKITYFNP
jgi:hypothetical protein